jgi:transcription initiation factor TFIIH subunit 1
MRARQSAHVIHDINQHAAVVMQGLPQAGEQDADGRLRRSREAATSGGSALQLEDLQGPAATGFSRLRIQDPKRFYESMGGAAEEAQEPPMENGRTDESMAGAGDALAAVEQLCRTGLGSPAVDPGASQRALLELCQGFHDRGNPLAALQAGLGGGGMQQQQQQQLLPQLQGVLRETVLTGNELLRHFWGAFPLSSAAREARALRLKRALAEQFDRTTAMQEAAAGAERVRITQLLKPLRAALDAALSKHDREVELRSAGQ